MKKKQKKVRIKRNKKELDKTFPTQLNREDYFKCPIWFADAPQFVKDINKASDPYIKTAQENLKKGIDERNKKFGDKGDMGNVFHSTTLIGDPNFKVLTDYILQKCGYRSLLKKVRVNTVYILTGMVISQDSIF